MVLQFNAFVLCEQRIHRCFHLTVRFLFFLLCRQTVRFLFFLLCQCVVITLLFFPATVLVVFFGFLLALPFRLVLCVCKCVCK